MAQPTSLAAIAHSITTAEQADYVRRALRRALRGSDLSDEDRASLTAAHEDLDAALKASSARTIESSIEASLSGGTRVLRMLNKLAPESTREDPGVLARVKSTLKAVLSNEKPASPALEEAIGFYLQLTSRALDSFQSKQAQLAAPWMA